MTQGVSWPTPVPDVSASWRTVPKNAGGRSLQETRPSTTLTLSIHSAYIVPTITPGVSRGVPIREDERILCNHKSQKNLAAK